MMIKETFSFTKSILNCEICFYKLTFCRSAVYVYYDVFYMSVLCLKNSVLSMMEY